MKERGILFKTEMVTAIIKRRKTLTSRLMKDPEYYGCTTGDCPHSFQTECDAVMAAECPYGQPGDRLWVRETFKLWDHSVDCVEVEYRDGGQQYVEMEHRQKRAIKKLHSRKRNGQKPWRPGIHMFRWASRINLEVAKVWASRLQDMTEEMAENEGVTPMGDFASCMSRDLHLFEYQKLWDSINGKPRRVKVDGEWVTIPGQPWASNPWVWRVQFKVLDVESPLAPV